MKNVDKLKYHYQKFLFEDLPEGIREHVFVAGGAIRDYLSGDDIKDIDLFVTSKEVEDKLISFLKENGELINENDVLANYTYKKRWVQVIRGKHFASALDLINAFDFTICQAALSYKMELIPEENKKMWSVEFDSSDTFFQDTLAKHLRIHAISFPLSTLERMQKYIQKGYTACNGTLLEVAKSMVGLDLENPQNNSLMFYPNGSARFFGVD